MTALTRGPLPARVYWTRRVLVLGTALLLVVGVVRLLAGGTSPEPDRAVQVAAEPEPTEAAPTTSMIGPTLTDASSARAEQGKQRKGKQKQGGTQPVLVEPEGVCTADDIAVTPLVKDAEAGRSVMIVLKLRTIQTAACSWQVSPETLTLKITSGDDEIWSSRECPAALPEKSVVVRQAVTTRVGVRWSGKRSDEECSGLAGWAMPGWYHVAAAALAGEPSDVQFELERPRPEVVVKTVPADRGKDEDRKDEDPKDQDPKDQDGDRRGGDDRQGQPKHR